MMKFNCRANKSGSNYSMLLVLLMLIGLLSQQVYAAADDWKIRIKSSVGSYNSSITFGEFADATDGYDVVYDGPAHTAPAAVVAYFDHPEWGLTDTKFWYDIQSQGLSRQWTFYTDSNLDGQTLELEWYFSNVPADYHITLTDNSTAQSIDMMAETSYSYVSGDLRQFSVTAVMPSPPLLTISDITDGAVVNSPDIVLAGTATDAGQGDSGIASVMVNAQSASGGVVSGAETAQWSYATTLSEGVNVFTIVATDGSAYSDQTTETISITYTPVDLDSDADGLLDDWELTHFGNLTSSTGAADEDTDGLSNSEEYTYGSNPNNADSDADGIEDGVEVSLGTNPNSSDSDGDGDSDADEILYGSDPSLSTDTIDSHRPYTPVLRQVSDLVALEGHVFDAEAFDDIDILDGDYLAISQWQISTDQAFSDTAIVLDRQFERDSSAGAGSELHRQLTMPSGVLMKAGQYWIRTRHQDSIGLWSNWSTSMSFNTVTSDPNDLSEDGIDDRYQFEGFVDTDGNGVNDNEEAGIYPVLTAAFTETIGLSPNEGEIGYLSVMSSSVIAEDLLPEESLAYHLFDFRVEGLPVDVNNPASVEIIFYFPGSLPAGTKWYKYDAATQTMSDYSSNVVIDERRVTLTLVDGGAGDADGVVNGVVVDPSGPALPVVSTQVSTDEAPGSGGADFSATPEPGADADEAEVVSSVASAVGGGGAGTVSLVFLILVLISLYLSVYRHRKA